MRHRTKWLTAVALCAGMALSASHAQAKVPGPNGRIAFSRYVQDDNTVTYTVNPDGSHMQQLFPGFSGGPRWSPDGSQVSLLAPCTDGEENCAATIVDPDTGTFRQFKRPDPDLETNCTGWSPDGTRLLCDSFGVTDPSRNGIYTILASDGRGLSRITSNPGGEDIPGDYAPDGKRLVFSRTDPSRPTNANVALFVVNVDRTGLRRITPWGLPFWEDAGRWSPDGSTILFDDQRSLFVVHPDGSGMAKIPLVTRGFSRLQNPNWSPDGTKIVVSLFKATSSGTGQAGIYTANADGSDLQQVTGSPTFDRDGDWGPHPLAPSGQNDAIQSSHERPTGDEGSTREILHWMKNRMLPRPQEPAPSVAGATLAVAAVFQLVRRRIQSGGRPALQPAPLRRRPDDQHMARK